MSFLQAVLFIEQEKYSEALELLLKSKAVLSKLTEAVGAIQKAHIIEKVAQIDNNLRFCRYQLNEYAGNYDELM
jgi:DNA-binding XRE family transcriptional regulator